MGEIWGKRKGKNLHTAIDISRISANAKINPQENQNTFFFAWKVQEREAI
jgi:hypothetical protein